METVAELLLGAGLDAVPDARRFATSTLSFDRAGLVDDAELVVSELVGNAVLHGAAPATLRISRLDDRVRIEVEDAGRTMPVPMQRTPHAVTGRGLALVAALSVRWGVQPLATGKLVWAELGEEPALRIPDDAINVDALLAEWADDADMEQHFTVRLGAVPTDLLLAAKEHIDSVVRELTLAAAHRPPRQLSAETAGLVDVVTRDFADARAEIKRQALLAAARGDASTDLVLHLPLSAADAGERYLQALDQADRYARAARLLTLAPPRSHRTFRRWYVQALVDQLRAAARGEHWPTPAPFSQVLADEVDRLAPLEDAWDRLQLLQKVTAQLASASTVADVAGTVVRSAAEFLGAASGRVYLVVDDVLRSVAVHGGGSAAGSYADLPLDAHLPGPVVVRTGQPLFLRSLAQLRARFPLMAGYSHGERSVHVAPLGVGDHILGVLALTFAGSRNIDEESQIAFVGALADMLAQALERALLTESAAESR